MNPDVSHPEALVQACALEADLGVCIAQVHSTRGRLVDLEVVAADPTVQRLVPGLAPGVRASQLLPPQRLQDMLWYVWSHDHLHAPVDNRDGSVPELLAGAVFDVVQIVVGAQVLWLVIDRSQHLHWQERALNATQEVQASFHADEDQTDQVAGQLFEMLVAWRLVRDSSGEVVDAVIAYLNEAARQLAVGSVRAGRRLSELVVPHLLPVVLQYLQDHADPGSLDQRVFGPQDFEVHLVQALHGRVRLFGVGGDVIVALLADDTALVEVAEQARVTLSRLSQVRDDEGRRLATRIHDGPLQTLSVVRWELESATAEAPTQLAEALKRAQAALDAAESELRTEIFALSPPGLETSGVFVAVSALAERLRRDNRRVDVALSGEASLSRESGTLLIRCVQELLRNVDLHSGAAQVHVSVVGDDELVTVVVNDDGDGFDASDPALWLGRDHFGLASCKLLLELAGGGMWVESHRGGVGTHASCWLPQDRPRPVGQGVPAAPTHQRLRAASLTAAALRQEFEQRRHRTSGTDPTSTWRLELTDDA